MGATSLIPNSVKHVTRHFARQTVVTGVDPDWLVGVKRRSPFGSRGHSIARFPPSSHLPRLSRGKPTATYLSRSLPKLFGLWVPWPDP